MKFLFKRAWLLKLLLNIWPPFLFAGIHVVKISPDYRQARIELRQRPWNRNAVGVHFGGSLFAMSDPMYMLMLMGIFKGEYLIWDKAACIDFIKPGRGTVYAEFEITDHLLEDIKRMTASGEKYLPVLPVVIKDGEGDTVATVERTLYIKKKKQRT